MLVFMVATMGMTISRHYCGNTLRSVDVFSTADNCCNIPAGCCQDKTTTVSVDHDFSMPLSNYDLSTFVLELPGALDLSLAVNAKVSTSKLIDFVQLPVKSGPTVLACLQAFLL
jgi:hypothetical protein